MACRPGADLNRVPSGFVETPDECLSNATHGDDVVPARRELVQNDAWHRLHAVLRKVVSQLRDLLGSQECHEFRIREFITNRRWPRFQPYLCAYQDVRHAPCRLLPKALRQYKYRSNDCPANASEAHAGMGSRAEITVNCVRYTFARRLKRSSSNSLAPRGFAAWLALADDVMCPGQLCVGGDGGCLVVVMLLKLLVGGGNGVIPQLLHHVSLGL